MSDWLIHQCVNCEMLTHAIRTMQGNNQVLVNMSLKVGQASYKECEKIIPMSLLYQLFSWKKQLGCFLQSDPSIVERLAQTAEYSPLYRIVMTNRVDNSPSVQTLGLFFVMLIIFQLNKCHSNYPRLGFQHLNLDSSRSTTPCHFVVIFADHREIVNYDHEHDHRMFFIHILGVQSGKYESLQRTLTTIQQQLNKFLIDEESAMEERIR